MQLVKSLKTALGEAIRTVMPTCREASRLQSLEMDHSLPWHKRFGLRLHLAACKWCRRYGRQIRFLRRAAQEQLEDMSETAPRSLSPEARERLKRSLSEERRK